MLALDVNLFQENSLEISLEIESYFQVAILIRINGFTDTFERIHPL